MPVVRRTCSRQNCDGGVEDVYKDSNGVSLGSTCNKCHKHFCRDCLNVCTGCLGSEICDSCVSTNADAVRVVAPANKAGAWVVSKYEKCEDCTMADFIGTVVDTKLSDKKEAAPTQAKTALSGPNPEPDADGCICRYPFFCKYLVCSVCHDEPICLACCKNRGFKVSMVPIKAYIGVYTKCDDCRESDVIDELHATAEKFAKEDAALAKEMVWQQPRPATPGAGDKRPRSPVPQAGDAPVKRPRLSPEFEEKGTEQLFEELGAINVAFEYFNETIAPLITTTGRCSAFLKGLRLTDNKDFVPADRQKIKEACNKLAAGLLISLKR